MVTTRVVNGRTGQLFLADLREAREVWERFTGLMFRASLGSEQGLVFRPARGIHTHFMRFAIDLVFLDEVNQVVAIRPAMPPWRFDQRSTAAVIEANAGAAAAADVQLGDELRFETASM